MDRQVRRTILSDASEPLLFRHVIELLEENPGFRAFITKAIAENPYDACFWETPPFTKRTLDRSFEFVVVESTSLAGLRADPSPFESHFSTQRSELVLTFPNLGGDALLVVPTPMSDKGCYAHLARFLRSAPGAQVDAFWRSAGRAMRDRVSERPTWFSTAGMGVSWLHLRLDSRPKYYRYEPYKKV